MGIINVLDTQTSNLIAAGEVVERPASVVKELMENSIDAGAKRITVEIQNGGVTYIRVTDDGVGMTREDAVTCMLRHATSKISSPDDLSGISTLGFRGEALAAISSVCRFKIFTKKADEPIGTLVSYEPGNEVRISDAGCPNGTSMIVSDLFFNVPARRKFLKKDFSEAMAVSAVVDKIAISHPEITVQYIVDNKVKYTTKGDGKLENAIYVTLGKQFFDTQIKVVSGYNESNINVSGFTCKPECGRSNRNMQYTFINGRTFRSKTVSAALEEAYRTYMPEGNFPTCVLFLDVDAHSVDVNVHPTKQEVKFTAEKLVFDAVYYAIKNTISNIDSHPELKMETPSSYEQKGKELFNSFIPVTDKPKTEEKPFVYTEEVPSFFTTHLDIKCDEEENEKAAELFKAEQKPDYKIIGEAYNCYIFVELPDRIMVIDKHAAHERILYNEIIGDKTDGFTQSLLMPVSVTLSKTDMASISEYLDDIKKVGFDIEIFGSDTVIVREIPLPLTDCDIEAVITSLAGALSDGSGRVKLRSAVYERALFTAACKAAMKGGQHTNSMQNSFVVEKVLTDNKVRYCPHGRPVAYEIRKSSLENQFGR